MTHFGSNDPRTRLRLVAAGVALAFAAVGVQLVRIAALPRQEARIAILEAVPQALPRPDIVDRRGRLLATDVMAPSLFADPWMVVDPGDTADRLVALFPDLDARELRRSLADRTRRFVWIKRGLSPRIAQVVHDLGLPGLGFRNEPRRTYPGVRLAGHVIGTVGTENQGLAGIERRIDAERGPDGARARDPGPPLRLTLDLGVQHGLEAELSDAMTRYRAAGAAGVVLDAETGEVLALASLPAVDPARLSESLDPARADKVTGGVYELGSIFKMVTVAMALDHKLAGLETVLDVRVPLTAGRWQIRDSHPAGRPLTVRDVFIQSSNVGAGMLALETGPLRQRAFLDRLGLTAAMRTEAGPVAPPKMPKSWGRAETITIAYGHGLAVAPLQFAAAAASLVNGGYAVTPTLVADPGPPAP